MTDLSRRNLIKTGVATATGIAGLGVGIGLAKNYGLIPPDCAGIWGVGETLNYATYRLLTNHSMAREFERSEISAKPLANEMPPLTDEFKTLQAGGFANWRLTVDGMVDRPGTFSLEQLRAIRGAARSLSWLARRAGRMWQSGPVEVDPQI